MPGMMDTILNLGLNDRTIRGLIERSRDPRLAYDSYRRFIQMYGDVVLGIGREKMEELISAPRRMAAYLRRLHGEGIADLDDDFQADGMPWREFCQKHGAGPGPQHDV